MINKSHIRHYPPVKQQRCQKCKYYYLDTNGQHICVNDLSEKCMEHTESNDYCNEYNSKR